MLQCVYFSFWEWHCALAPTLKEKENKIVRIVFNFKASYSFSYSERRDRSKKLQQISVHDFIHLKEFLSELLSPVHCVWNVDITSWTKNVWNAFFYWLFHKYWQWSIPLFSFGLSLNGKKTAFNVHACNSDLIRVVFVKKSKLTTHFYLVIVAQSFIRKENSGLKMRTVIIKNRSDYSK